jgi:hypothetical protein
MVSLLFFVFDLMGTDVTLFDVLFTLMYCQVRIGDELNFFLADDKSNVCPSSRKRASSVRFKLDMYSVPERMAADSTGFRSLCIGSSQ